MNFLRKQKFMPYIVKLLGTAVISLLFVAPAFSGVQTDIFEVDGDIIADEPGEADWAGLFDVVGTAVPTVKASLPPGVGPAFFNRDFVIGSGYDSTTFTTGSKDTLNIGNGGWQCGPANNISSKVDLLDAYGAAYIDSNGHVIVYFGMETASNEGTRDVGIWLLKDNTVNCSSSRGSHNFTGHHTDGDILITAEYGGTNGVSLIQAFKWIGDDSGHLDTNPFVTGGDCKNGNSSTTICGSTNLSVLYGPNESNPVGVPWLVQTKLGKTSTTGVTTTDLDVAEYFEGGIDLTANGLSGCFAKMLSDTRSSASPTATIFDFTVGSFPLCGVSVGKACDTTAQNNPHVLADGLTLETQFNINIKTTGPGTVSAVTLAETPTLSQEATAQCKITAVTTPTGAVLNSQVSSLPISFSGSTALSVYDTLPGNTTGMVTVVCDTTGANPFNNAVTINGKSSSSLDKPDLSASHTVLTAEACPFNVSPTLTPEKSCETVTVDASTLKPQVCVGITLTNNSNEALTGVSVNDNKVGLVTFPILGPVGSATASSKQKLCYTPTVADTPPTPSVPGQINPEFVKFSDQLTEIQATGVVSGKVIDLKANLPSAQCPLCVPPQGDAP